MSVVGVRYTTARHTAEQATDLALRMLNRPAIASRTAITPLVGGDIDDYATFIRETPAWSRRSRATARHANACRGCTAPSACASKRSPRRASQPLAQPIGANCPVLGAEIVFAVREEMAVHLTDALLRRTDAGSAGHPGADAVENAARVMGDILGWSDERRREEIAAVERVYTIEG